LLGARIQPNAGLWILGPDTVLAERREKGLSERPNASNEAAVMKPVQLLKFAADVAGALHLAGGRLGSRFSLIAFAEQFEFDGHDELP